MSHEIDQSNDRANMAYSGEVPWHGLGQSVSPDDSIETWSAAAGLEWEAKRAPAMYTADDGEQYASGEHVLYRSDTKAKLGIVSEGYESVQPAEVLDFFRHYVEDLGAFEMHTVGSLREGRRIWALAKAKDGLYDLAGDKIGRYLLLATSYDKTMATFVQQTSIRVVCNNTLTAAFMAGGKRVDPVIRVSHHGKFDASKVRAQMLFDGQWVGFTQSIERWAARKVDRTEQDQFFRAVLELPELAAADVKKQAAQDKKLAQMDEIVQGAPGQQLESAKDTAWGLVNAVTFLVDHGTGKNPDVRMDQAWFGQRRYMKRRAMEQAELLCA